VVRKRLIGSPASVAQGGIKRGAECGLVGTVRLAGHGCLDRRRFEAQVAVVARRAVDHRVPGAGDPGDVLECGDREVSVLRLGLLEDGQHLLRVVVPCLEDRVQRLEVDALEARERAVGHRAAGTAERRLLAALSVGLGCPPVDVEAALGVHATHVDALDRAGLGALEAGLALERAVLVVEQLQAAAELGRDVGVLLGPHDGGLGLEEPPQGQAHAADQAHAGNEAHRTLTGS
jgi:hypothetical protein